MRNRNFFAQYLLFAIAFRAVAEWFEYLAFGQWDRERGSVIGSLAYSIAVIAPTFAILSGLGVGVAIAAFRRPETLEALRAPRSWRLNAVIAGVPTALSEVLNVADHLPRVTHGHQTSIGLALAVILLGPGAATAVLLAWHSRGGGQA
jgi:hypothetical protein